MKKAVKMLSFSCVLAHMEDASVSYITVEVCLFYDQSSLSNTQPFG
jgi:hypothetical protein